MMFLFKKKPIVLTCVTNREELVDLAPIRRASKTLPEWWKTLPRFVPSEQQDLTTMKTCAGFTDLYGAGAVMPMWCDLLLKIGKTGTADYFYQFSDERSSISVHPAFQHNNNFDPLNYQHLKLNSPWLFSCEEEIKFITCEPTWSFINFSTARVMPGIVNYLHQSGTNINLFVKRTEEEQKFVIPFLEPLFHVIPLSNRPLKIVNIYDERLFKKSIATNYVSTFINKYKSNIKARKT